MTDSEPWRKCVRKNPTNRVVSTERPTGSRSTHSYSAHNRPSAYHLTWSSLMPHSHAGPKPKKTSHFTKRTQQDPYFQQPPHTAYHKTMPQTQPQKLSDADLQSTLANLPGWQTRQGQTPSRIQIRRLHPCLRFHGHRRARHRKDEPSPGMVQRLQPRRRRPDHSRRRRHHRERRRTRQAARHNRQKAAMKIFALLACAACLSAQDSNPAPAPTPDRTGRPRSS